MEMLDLFALQQTYNQQRIMLCFNGPLTRSLIEEIGNALRNYMRHENHTATSVMDVFSAYIEITQNIRQYAMRKGWSESEVSATVIIARDIEGRYVISAGNILDEADGDALMAYIHSLSNMDKEQLKSQYKAQLRRPRKADSTNGAGLGLIDLARKASEPLACALRALSHERAFFSLRVILM